MPSCPACRAENLAKARFCSNCGARLRTGSPQRVRKQVTVLCTDVVDSKALGRQLDLERLNRVLERYFEVARGVLERHGALVHKYVGDAVMAVFGVPEVHTDDALRAVRAADELHAMVRTSLNAELRCDWGVELQVHTAIGTGTVMAEEGQAWDVGVASDLTNLVFELIKLAGPDGIVIANATFRLVRGTVKVEPLHAPTAGGDGIAFTVLEFTELPHRLMAPMVGRRWELNNWLRAHYDGVLEHRSCMLVSVLGPPGIGKTRLVDEFVRRLSRRPDLRERPQVLRGQCLRPEADSTYYPMRQMLRQAAGIRADAPVEEAQRLLALLVEGSDPLMARLAPFIGLPGGQPAEPEDTIRAICYALAIVGRKAPLVLIVDDLHQAEPPLLDILERVKDWLTDVPVLIVAVSREELLDRERDWSGWLRNASSRTLLPLRRDEAEQMIGQILFSGEPDPRIVTTIAEEAGGSPLDVEALLGSLLDDGALRLEDGRWTFSGDLSMVKDLLQRGAAFAARIERLEDLERQVMYRAAVVGLQFRTTDVHALLPEHDRDTVTATLDALVRKELMKPAREAAVPFMLDDESYTFRHAAYHQAAYERLPIEDRVDLHERYATWLAQSGDNVPATVERVAYHLEQSYRGHVALRGHGTPRAADLARQAGEWYARAGRGYITQGAFPVPYAERALTNAVRLLPERSSEQLGALLDLADTLQEPDRDRARQIYEEVAEAASGPADRLVKHHAEFGLMERNFLQEGKGWNAKIVRGKIKDFESQEINAGAHLRAKAYRLLAHVEWSMGMAKQALAPIDQAITLIEQAKDARLRAKIVSLRCTILFWGPDPLEIVELEIQRAIDWARHQGMFSLEATGLYLLARIAAIQGDPQRARERLREAEAKAGGPDFLTYALDVISKAMVEALAGNLEGAEKVLEEAYRAHLDKGIGIPRSTVAAWLARILLQRGRHAEAGKYIDECRAATDDEQLDGQVKWRHLHAVALARQGELPAAELLAREAVKLSQASEQPLTQAEAFQDLAEILRAAGKVEEASDAAEKALRLYRGKGHIVAEREVERLRDRLRHRAR